LKAPFVVRAVGNPTFISVYPPEVFKLSIWESCKTVSLYYALVAQSASDECIIGRLCQSLHLLLHLQNHGADYYEMWYRSVPESFTSI
jgi:hypothetical protein